MQETLSIISIILSKTNLRYASLFVSKGLLEILIELLPENYIFIGIVVNIIGNICIESDDYCEIILLNFKHELFINVFKDLHEKLLRNLTK
jgi:hypothetical protein